MKIKIIKHHYEYYFLYIIIVYVEGYLLYIIRTLLFIITLSHRIIHLFLVIYALKKNCYDVFKHETFSFFHNVVYAIMYLN